jgi:branched-chain amino acid transport system substrate-binding protein
MKRSTYIILAAVIVIVGIALYIGFISMAPPAPTTTTPSTTTPTQTPTPSTPPRNITVKVGIALPLTGAFALFGQDTLKGVLSAIEMFNEKQLIPGVTVVPVVADTQSDPTIAASEAERLITVEKVDILIGSYAGALAMAMSSVAEKYNTPFYEVIAAPNNLTMYRGYKWVFRFGPAGLYYGYVAVDFLVEFAKKMGWDIRSLKIAVVHEDSAYGTSCADGDVERLKYYGLTPVTRERYSAATTDLSSLIMKLKSLGIDVVLITSYASDAQLFLRQSYELGFKPKIIIGHSAGYELPATAEAVGELIKGVFVVGFPPRGMNLSGLLPEVQKDINEFIQYYKNKYGSLPASWGAKAFSATYHVFLKGVLKIAIEKYGKVDRETIRQAFLEVDIPQGGTVVGFGAKFAPPDHPYSGENLRATIHPVCEWFGTKPEDLEAVWPSELAIAEPQYIPRP